MADRTKALTDPVIGIGTFAEKTGLSVAAIRKYEAEGLIIPHRTASGYRKFSYEDLDRVKIIRHLIQNMGLNMAGIRMLQALLPCWELVECPEDERCDCAAYNDKSSPCWMIKGGRCSPDGNECRRCVVYRFGSQCTEDIKTLVRERRDKGKLREEANKILNKTDEEVA